MIGILQKVLKKIIVFFKRDNTPSLQNEYNLLNKMPMEVALYDVKGNYTFVNKQYIGDKNIADSVIGKNDEYYFNLIGISPECVYKRKGNFKRAFKEKTTIRFTETLYFPEKAKTIYYKRFCQPVFSEDGGDIESICLFGSNITAIIHAQKELKYIAYHDKLTGLRNRDAFYEILDQIIVESERDISGQLVAVLFCDLDNFKLVNDSLGHHCGDLVLKEVAERLQKCLRKADYVFRFGGDEFTALCKNIKKDYEAGKIAEKILKSISKPYNIEGHQITYLSPSIGIVLFPKDGITRDVLVKKADTAMYNAKSKGKNNFQFFSGDITDKSIKKIKIETNLREVIKEKDYENQFQILYQPIVEKKIDGNFEIIGSEVLLRWNNPELGLVLPDIFIPVAEETDLINSIGEWVFYKSCKDLKFLADKYKYPFYLSINYSNKQIKSPNIIKKIKKIIRDFEINPANLQFELSEASYLDNEIQVVKNINALKKMGIKLAIDDFSVDFISLVYLQKIPASTIKIDKSYIQCASINERHKDFVKSIIILGKNLNKDIIAEGIEQIDQVNFLEAQKCIKYQGYLFSKPITLKEFEECLKNKNKIHLVLS